MIVIAVSAAAVIAAGCFLRWATAPCLLAYELGRQVQRVRDSAGRHHPARARGPASPDQRGR